MKFQPIATTVGILASLLAMAVPADASSNPPADTLGIKRLRIYPSPGPGHEVQLTLHRPPSVRVLVTIQDRLGFTRYQQWHAPGERITVRFNEFAQSLPPGLYSAVISSPKTYLKEKFIVE